MPKPTLAVAAPDVTAPNSPPELLPNMDSALGNDGDASARPMISFLMRVHNEESTLRAAISSLFTVRVPAEIIVVLHRCTDASASHAAAMVHAAPPHIHVRVLKYAIPVSRAGIETLVTQTYSRHSLPTYYSAVWALASAAWTCKWDGDWIATPEFTEWVSTTLPTIPSDENVSLKLGYKNDGADGSTGSEWALTNCNVGFRKQLLWEIPLFSRLAKSIRFLMDQVPQVCFRHASDLAKPKPYWSAVPWFMASRASDGAPVTPQAAELRALYADAMNFTGNPAADAARAGTNVDALQSAAARWYHERGQRQRDERSADPDGWAAPTTREGWRAYAERVMRPLTLADEQTNEVGEPAAAQETSEDKNDAAESVAASNSVEWSVPTLPPHVPPPVITLHLLGIPHTITKEEYSHCAFTAKVLKFAAMMRTVRGFRVVHYGVEGAATDADEQVTLMSREEWAALRARTPGVAPASLADPTAFVGNLAIIDGPLYRAFNARLRAVLVSRNLRLGWDIVCAPFGPAHNDALQGLPLTVVESGIGYLNPWALFRVYESYYWQAWHSAKAGQENGNYAHAVIPNYFVADDWPLVKTPSAVRPCADLPPRSRRVGFLGRITSRKGLPELRAIAEVLTSLDVQVLACGQGTREDRDSLTKAGIVVLPPMSGVARAAYLGSLAALIAPSQMIEPFCGVVVEAALCGTPAMVPPYGATTETVAHGVSGMHCRSLGDYVRGALQAIAGDFDRAAIAANARAHYSLQACAPRYASYFRWVHAAVLDKGWNRIAPYDIEPYDIEPP